MPQRLVEVAVETLSSAIAADRGGAGRIELCAHLNAGGITPGAELVSTVVEHVRIPVFVMIRPRGGNFVYSDQEFDSMCRDLALMRALGVRGFAIGILNRDHSIDVRRLRLLVEAASGSAVTFHRAFDLAPDRSAALDQLIEADVSRVLTAGGEATAIAGSDALADLVAQAHGRLVVMPGGGIREDNVRAVIMRTNALEIHTRLSSGEELDESRVRRFVELCQTA